MDQFKKKFGIIKSVYSKKIQLNESFMDFSARFAPLKGTVILMSGGDTDCARYHILAAKPWLFFSGRGSMFTVYSKKQAICFDTDPFNMLKKILHYFKLNSDKYFLPVASGLFGYFSYDLKDYIEKLPRTSVDDLGLPHICLFAPSIVVVHDKKEKSTWLNIPRRFKDGYCSIDHDLNEFENVLKASPVCSKKYSKAKEPFNSNLTKKKYKIKVEKIKKYITMGHVYQVNMSQRFETCFKGDTFSLFKDLYAANPAPFFSYINAQDHIIVSTSPERFIKKEGEYIETRPIKGTRPRGKTCDEDRKNREELKCSKKDDAELSMIVDLLRNDLGKVCCAGFVHVSEHKKVEKYENVYHLVSVVKGKIDKKFDCVDLIKATFPGGSITGCPKIRSMEIIDELEKNRRHIYTGSIGYISFHDTMDLSIAIRTATILNERMYFSVGGGVVFDSDPEDEYNETLHKGKTFINVFDGKKTIPNKKKYVWLNGSIVPDDQACIKISDQGLQYGYGFFETIRVNYGKAKYLKEHIERFNNTWRFLFPQEICDLTWDEIIRHVIEKNSLKNKIAAVKIMVTKGDKDQPAYNNSFIVTSRQYISRLHEKKDNGLHIASYPEPRQTPLADYKTLNYLYYLNAGKWAKSMGADEALILNPDQTVSETNTANILLIKHKTVILPDSAHCLPGIMQQVVCDFLKKTGYEIKQKKFKLKNLFDADMVFITNSLIGALPVLSIDKIQLKEPSCLWQKINKIVL